MKTEFQIRCVKQELEKQIKHLLNSSSINDKGKAEYMQVMIDTLRIVLD